MSSKFEHVSNGVIITDIFCKLYEFEDITLPQKSIVVGEPGMITFIQICFNFSNMIFIPGMFQSKGILQLQVEILFGIKLSCYYTAHITNPIGKNIKIIYKLYRLLL